MLEKIILALSECQKELTQTLVDGGSNLADDNRIRGEIHGLTKAKTIIYETFEEENKHAGDTEEQDE